MIIQHNMSAMNANRMLGIVNNSQSKSTEKLSSGYRINRAADDAAGLSISEKMRAQIRGLNQASTNAQDGISLIQTAEGGLNETHAILQRMRELAVQAANGTETDDDREAVADEINQLQAEIDRISTDTEFNTMKLLDGSLDGGAVGGTGSGPKFGTIATAGMTGAIITSSITGVEISIAASSATKVGTETAVWSNDGKTLNLNLASTTNYSQSDIDRLIKNAKQEDSTATNQPVDITVKLMGGSFTSGADGSTATTGKTTGGVKAATQEAAISVGPTSFVGASSIQIIMNRYGDEVSVTGKETTINLVFDAKKNSERVDVKDIVYDTANSVSAGGVYTLHLESGKEYTSQDIEKLLADANLDVTVKLSGAKPDEPNTIFAVNGEQSITDLKFGDGTKSVDGAGVGSANARLGQDGYEGTTSGGGMTLQIGANEGQTMTFGIKDMGTKSLGIDGSKVNIQTQENAQSSITRLDDAIKMVSKERGKLGAIQNRLEHTISNLDTSAENLQSAESRIRDVDMAKEMVEFSKNNILMQASQSMLAQANQSTQGVLSLLQ